MNTAIEVKKKSLGWVDIFEFKWELDETNVDNTFTSLYSSVWDFKDKKIIFNFSWLNYLNSKSIWYIADIFSNIEEGNWTMFITNLNDEVKDTLDLVWITQIIQVTDTEIEALSQLWVTIA